jgi:hypothetical protein
LESKKKSENSSRCFLELELFLAACGRSRHTMSKHTR